MITDPRIPELIYPLLEDYLLSLNHHMPGLIRAFYIVGSIALSEFNEHFSDIDFIAVPDHRITAAEAARLQGIHQAIEKKHPRWKMSGSYIQRDDLGKPGDCVEPFPHFKDGILRISSGSALNWVTWWELKNHGIPITGMLPSELSFTVDWDLLIAEMRTNLNSYWRSWTNQPGRIIVLFSDWGIQWAVLGVLRQFFSFREHSITTKLRAGKYALGCLPPQWHRLIHEAMDIRKGQKGSRYRSRVRRMIEAVRFLTYIINTCNADG